MHDRIEINPDICHGKPVIRGTRIMVRNILGALAGGDSVDMILQNYPELTFEDIEAALAYAIELVDDTQVTLRATADEDFQNPLLVENIPGCGVIRLNVYPTGFKQTKDALQRLLDTYPVDKWKKASIIVDANKIRYRKK